MKTLTREQFDTVHALTSAIDAASRAGSPGEGAVRFLLEKLTSLFSEERVTAGSVSGIAGPIAGVARPAESVIGRWSGKVYPAASGSDNALIDAMNTILYKDVAAQRAQIEAALQGQAQARLGAQATREAIGVQRAQRCGLASLAAENARQAKVEATTKKPTTAELIAEVQTHTKALHDLYNRVTDGFFKTDTLRAIDDARDAVVSAILDAEEASK